MDYTDSKSVSLTANHGMEVLADPPSHDYRSEKSNGIRHVIKLLHAEIRDSILIVYDFESGLINHAIHVDDIVGCSFVVNVESMQSLASGTITVVTRKQSIAACNWHSWISLLALALVIYGSLFLILGPWSAMLMMAIWVADTFDISQGFTKKSDLNSDAMVVRYFMLSLALCTITVLLYLYAMTLAESRTTIGITVSMLLLISLHLCLNNATIALPPLPEIQHPVVLKFCDEDIVSLIQLRRYLFEDEKLRQMITRIWVGGSAVEAALSYLMPAYVYNSRSIRKFLFILSNYLLPMYTVMRGLGALIPPCEFVFSFLMARTQMDIGLGLLYIHSRVVWTRTYVICSKFYNLCVVPMDKLILINFMNNFQMLFQPFYSVLFQFLYSISSQLFAPYVVLFRILNQILTLMASLVKPLCSIGYTMLWPLYYLVLQIYYLTSVVSFTVLSTAKSFVHTVVIALVYSYNALLQLLRLVSQCVMSLVRLYRDVFVRPMPAPNYAQLTNNVVASSTKLMQHVKHLGSPSLSAKVSGATSARASAAKASSPSSPNKPATLLRIGSMRRTGSFTSTSGLRNRRRRSHSQIQGSLMSGDQWDGGRSGSSEDLLVTSEGQGAPPVPVVNDSVDSLGKPGLVVYPLMSVGPDAGGHGPGGGDGHGHGHRSCNFVEVKVGEEGVDVRLIDNLRLNDLRRGLSDIPDTTSNDAAVTFESHSKTSPTPTIGETRLSHIHSDGPALQRDRILSTGSSTTHNVRPAEGVQRDANIACKNAVNKDITALCVDRIHILRRFSF